jgi:hypothetical protein
MERTSNKKRKKEEEEVERRSSSSRRRKGEGEEEEEEEERKKERKRRRKKGRKKKEKKNEGAVGPHPSTVPVVRTARTYHRVELAVGDGDLLLELVEHHQPVAHILVPDGQGAIRPRRDKGVLPVEV